MESGLISISSTATTPSCAPGRRAIELRRSGCSRVASPSTTTRRRCCAVWRSGERCLTSMSVAAVRSGRWPTRISDGRPCHADRVAPVVHGRCNGGACADRRSHRRRGVRVAAHAALCRGADGEPKTARRATRALAVDAQHRGQGLLLRQQGRGGGGAAELPREGARGGRGPDATALALARATPPQCRGRPRSLLQLKARRRIPRRMPSPPRLLVGRPGVLPRCSRRRGECRLPASGPAPAGGIGVNDVASWPHSLLTYIYDSSRARGLRGRDAADDLRQRRDLTYRAVLRAPRTGRRYAHTGGAHVARARPAADSHTRALAGGGGRPPAVQSCTHAPAVYDRQ